MTVAGSVDLDHCPTCGGAYVECGTPWPPSLHDVAQVRCRLPRGHFSPEHWHKPLWPGTGPLLWFDDEQQEQQQQGASR